MRPLPGVACSGLINDGCPWAPHSWRQSKTVPSESRSCPKSGWAGDVSGWPNSDWYHLKLPATSPTPMIVHVRFMPLLLRPDGGVDAAARIHSTTAPQIILRTPLPPLASNDLLCGNPIFGLHQTARIISSDDMFEPDIARQRTEKGNAVPNEHWNTGDNEPL